MTAQILTQDTQWALSSDWKKASGILCSGSYVCSIPMSCPCAIYSVYSTVRLSTLTDSLVLSENGYWHVTNSLYPHLNQCSSPNNNAMWTRGLITFQQYLLEMCNGISCSVDLAMRNPGCLQHTLYICEDKPSAYLKKVSDVLHSCICSNVVRHKKTVVLQRRS